MSKQYYPWHETVWQQLCLSKSANRLHHGLLLVDKAGRGLSDFAQAFAAKLLCEEDETLACGKCSACLLQQNNNHPDYLYIQPEEKGKAIKVDQIREAIDFYSLTAHAGQCKVLVIDPADAMNRNAANGLLKILEEPPANAILMLVTNNDALLPVTIRSRCQKISLTHQPDVQSMQTWLAQHTDIKNTEELLRLIDFAPLLAVEEESLHVLESRQEIIADVNALLTQRVHAMETAKRWSEDNPKTIVTTLWLLFSDMIKMKLLNNFDYVRNIDLEKSLLNCAKQLTIEQLSQSIVLLEQTLQRLNGPYNLNVLCVLEEIGLHLYNYNSVETRG